MVNYTHPSVAGHVRASRIVINRSPLGAGHETNINFPLMETFAETPSWRNFPLMERNG